MQSKFSNTRRQIIKAFPAIAVGAAVTTPAPAQAVLTPDERIAAAVEEIKAAYQEKYPDWVVISNEPQFYQSVHWTTKEVTEHGEIALIYALDPVYDPRRRMNAIFDLY